MSPESLAASSDDRSEDASAAFVASHIKRPRRTKGDLAELRWLILELVREYQPMTCRQVFYQLVSRGAIAKTEAEYNSTVCRLLKELRLSGRLPWRWIADGTRWMHKTRSFGSAAEAALYWSRVYRRARWEEQDVYVEVWLEKEALAGVLLDATDPMDVPLMVTRGYPSLTYVHSAAEQIASQGKPAFIYYFGDHDPSGVDISRNLEKRLREFAPAAEIHFKRVAVLPQQIEAWDLPTRPTKTTDTRTRNFHGESVEVDAIDPETLRDLAEEAIMQHVDRSQWDADEVAEESERTIFARIANREFIEVAP